MSFISKAIILGKGTLATSALSSIPVGIWELTINNAKWKIDNDSKENLEKTKEEGKQILKEWKSNRNIRNNKNVVDKNRDLLSIMICASIETQHKWTEGETKLTEILGKNIYKNWKKHYEGKCDSLEMKAKRFEYYAKGGFENYF